MILIDRGPLVPLGNSSGSQRMYVVHPLSGRVFDYVPLAQALSGAFRVYGVEADGLHAGTRPAATLDDMAVRYAAAIRREQPIGPYTLGGWSLGGVIAFEIARRLEQWGERVARLVLIDADRRHPPAPAPSALRRSFVADSAFFFGYDRIVEFAADADAGFSRLVRFLSGPDADPDRVRADLERRFDVQLALLRIVDGHDPVGPVHARTLMVCACGSTNAVTDWADAVDGPVRELHLSTDHWQCMTTPYVEQIAAAVRCL